MNKTFFWILVCFCFVLGTGCMVAQYIQGGWWFVGAALLVWTGVCGADMAVKLK